MATERMTAAEARKELVKAAGMQPESVIVKQARDYLRALGWYVMRIQQGIGCHRGISDLICVNDGRVVFVECKTAKGKLSDFQAHFRSELLGRGAEYVIVRSLEDVVAMTKAKQ